MPIPRRAGLAAFFLIAALAQPSWAAKPNIVFVLCDDLGYGDVKCFGGNRCQIETPNFDRLAREGMRFTHAYANASVCVPTRMAIMTGRYAWRFDRGRPGGPWGFLGTKLKTDQFTLGKMMRSAGYRTGYVGKWHLGTLMQTKDGKVQGFDNVDFTRPLEIGPPQYDFADSFILPGSLDMYPYAFVRNNRWVGEVTARKGWSAFNRVGPAAEDFLDVKVLEAFSHEAERFIGENAAASKNDQPFFLYLALTSPHTPTSPSEKFIGRSRIGIYGDFVTETDAGLGRVLAALDAHDLAENTLVIATSDHGPAVYAGRKRQATYGQLKELEQEGHYSAGPFRGYKFSVYEGAFRVPFVARWPAAVRPASTCSSLIGLPDVMATLAGAADYQLDPDQGPDSHSFLPLLKNPAADGQRQAIILQATRAMAIRAGSWKLCLCPGSGSDGRWGNLPKREAAWRQAVASYGKQPGSHRELEQAPFLQLFDLASDPAETRNLAAGQPDKVKELLDLMRRQVADGRTTAGKKLQNDRADVNLFTAVPSFVWPAPGR